MRLPWFYTLAILLVLAPTSSEAARRKPPIDPMVRLRKQLECEFNLLDVATLEMKLLTLTGEADQKLQEADYGSPEAKNYALKIKVLANTLILKTSSDNRLGLEAFLFAAEIEKNDKK